MDSLKNKLQLFKSLEKTSLKKPLPSVLAFLKPDNYVKSVTEINLPSLSKVGVKWIIMNVNIRSKEDERVKKLEWFLNHARSNRIKVLLLTNRTNRSAIKTNTSLNLEFDAVLTSSFKPFLIRKKKLMTIIPNLKEAYFISNDFIIDTPTANLHGIESTIIEENFLKVRWIDRKYHSYQRVLVTNLLERKNMISKNGDFKVEESQYDEFF